MSSKDRFIIEHFGVACSEETQRCRLYWHNYVKDTVTRRSVHVTPLPTDNDLRLLNFMASCILQDRGDVVQ